MTTLLDTLNDLEAKAKSATPGPWLNGYPNACKISPTPDHVWSINKDLIAKDLIEEDASYIAACSPETVLALITALREAREVIEFYAREKNWLDGSVGVDGGDKANAFLAKYPKGEQ